MNISKQNPPPFGYSNYEDRKNVHIDLSMYSFRDIPANILKKSFDSVGMKLNEDYRYSNGFSSSFQILATPERLMKLAANLNQHEEKQSPRMKSRSS